MIASTLIASAANTLCVICAVASACGSWFVLHSSSTLILPVLCCVHRVACSSPGQIALSTRSCMVPTVCGVQVAAINTAMGSLVKTCTTFPAERTIVTRERSKRSYDVGPYFLAKLLAELPVGALFPAVFGSLVYPTTGLHRKWSRSVLCNTSCTSSLLAAASGMLLSKTRAHADICCQNMATRQY